MEEFKQHYKGLIDESLTCQDKVELIKCEKYTDEVIRKDVLPEDIVDIHKNYILTLNLTREDVFKTLDVLQEIVKGFGYSYRDYQRLVDKLQVHDKTVEFQASSLQQTMLKNIFHNLIKYSNWRYFSGSTKSKWGIYFNLIDHNDGTMSFAVADVIGKGIPAALAMSMIKFGMDSYGHSQLPKPWLKTFKSCC